MQSKDLKPARDLRLTLLAVLAAIAVVLALLQRTGLAPLPHSTDGFLAGLAFGLGASAIIAWLVERD